MKKSRIILVLMTIVLVGTTLIMLGCSSTSTPSSSSTTTQTSSTTSSTTQAAKTLDVASIEALTGPVSGLYEIILRGEQLCVDWVNSNGGITVNGQKYTINLDSEDDQLSATGAINAAQRVVFDKNIKFVEGEVTPFLAEAIRSITDPNKVFYMIGQYDFPSSNFPYTFSAYFPYWSAKAIEYDYLVKTYPNVKTVAQAHIDEAANIRSSQEASKQITSHGLTELDNEAYPLGTQDFINILPKLMKFNPDAIDFNNENPNDTGVIIKEARQLGFTGPLVFNSPVDPVTVLGIIGNSTYATDAIMPTLDPGNLPPQATGLATLEKLWNDTYHVPFVLDSQSGWEPVYCEVQAIEKAQSLDPTVVAQAFQNMGTIDTLWGTAPVGGIKTFGFNACVLEPVPLSRLKDGKVEFIGFFPPNVP